MSQMSLNEIVSENLRRIREERALSLERLSELTGVSRSMLHQIERGCSSPTIATLYKITNSLKISLSDLTTLARPRVAVARRSDVEPMLEGDGSFRGYVLQPFTDEGRFEIILCEQDAWTRHSSEPHRAGTEEHITVCAGRLDVVVGEQRYSLGPGDFISFRGDQPHAYACPGAETAVFNLVLYYRR